MKSFFSRQRPFYQSMIIAIVLVALGILVQQYLEPKVGTILFLLMYPIVFFMAWIGGTRVAYFTILISMLSVNFFFVHPRYQFNPIDSPIFVRICLFVLSNALMIYIVHRLRKSEEKAIELFNKVTESENHYRAIIELSPHIIWYTDESGTVTYLNQTWCEYTGLSPESFHNNWELIIHPDDYEKSKTTWANAIKNKIPFELSLRMKRHDGEYRWFFSKTKPILDIYGNVIKWIGKSIEFHEQNLHWILKMNLFRWPLTSSKLL